MTTGTLPKLISREVLFGNPTRVQPRLSPDGTQIAFLAPHEGVLNLWLRPADGSEERPITEDKGRGIQSFMWSEDGRRLIYAQDQDGDENWHLWSTDIETGLVRDLTPFVGVQAHVLDSHPQHPAQLLVLMNLRDRSLRDVYRVDLDSGAVTLDTENPGKAIGWYVDSKFTVRGRFDTTEDGGNALFVRDAADADWREIARWPLTEIGSGLSFTEDDRGFYLVDSRGRDTAGLALIDLQSGEQTFLADDPEFDLEGAVFSPSVRGRIQAVGWNKERMEYRFFDEEMGARWQKASRVGQGQLSVVSRDRSDSRWLLAFNADDGPVSYHLFDPGSGESEFLFVHREDLVDLTLSSMQPISFHASDGLKIRGYLTRPAGAQAGPLPLVLLVHGGPWVRDSWGFSPQVQWLANRGYAVLQVNYRGSTGFGKAFLHAGDKEWGRRMQADLTDAVRWAVDEGIADAKKIAIMGGSYGGYAALAGITFTPDVYCAAVDIVGPSNLFTLIESIPPYWEPLREQFCRQVGDPQKEPELLRERSPLFHVDKIVTPLLIGQGANDPRVKEQESEQIVEAMRKNGKPVRYVLFPDEGHGFVRPENRLQFYGIAEQFLAKYLGGRCEPLPEDAYSGTGQES